MKISSKSKKTKTNKAKKTTKKQLFSKEKSSKTFKKSCKYKTKYVKDKYKDFKKEITVKFFEMLLTIKLFHWRTYSYGTHKATDELYEKFNEHMDKFIEVLIGKNERRIDLRETKTIKMNDLTTSDALRNKINTFIKYLMSLDKKKLGSDLYNIRDDIVTDLNQFLYSLSFL